jgi:Lrp/AsnC family transcriptional regulator, leucine-responsive regulatory protein
MSIRLDKIDTRILKLLQKNARTTNVEIERRLGMAPSSIIERTRKLEESGVIQGYTALINPKMVDAGLLAFVFVRADKWTPARRSALALAKHPWVLEIHDVAGEDCYLVKMRCRDTDALGHLLRDHFNENREIKSTRTTIVLATVKESGDIPLPDSR